VDNLDSILLISPVADLSDPVSPLHDAEMQIYNSFSGCRNDSALHDWGMGFSLICFRSPDSTSACHPSMAGSLIQEDLALGQPEQKAKLCPK
jgi:hypothetical protein